MQDTEAFAGLEAIRQRYLAVLEERLDMLECYATAIQSPDESSQALAAIQTQAHKISGTAATFGYVTLGDRARLVDETIFALQEAGTPPPDFNQLHDMIEALMDAIFDLIGDSDPAAHHAMV